MPLLTFGQSILHDVPHHKHLGVTIQNNCKWDTHIKNIASKANLLISCLRCYKYKLSRRALNTMYKSFILPVFDYADIIWDNCTKALSDSLEELQLEAIRTIIGAVRGTSHEKLYKESGICPLQERRKRHKLIFYHKLVNGNAPQYLLDLLPPLVSDQNPYHRRRPLERCIPRCRTEIRSSSFFLSTTRLWNNLPESIQGCTSISQFKRYLSHLDPVTPDYLYFGKRKQQIQHCRLRLGISNLNSDLQNRHLLDNPSCTCGHPNENAVQFLLHCPHFSVARQLTIDSLPSEYRNKRILLFGSDQLNIQTNINIFECVHEFIEKSERF